MSCGDQDYSWGIKLQAVIDSQQEQIERLIEEKVRLQEKVKYLSQQLEDAKQTIWEMSE